MGFRAVQIMAGDWLKAARRGAALHGIARTLGRFSGAGLPACIAPACIAPGRERATSRDSNPS